jgi:hypothetical protein
MSNTEPTQSPPPPAPDKQPTAPQLPPTDQPPPAAPPPTDPEGRGRWAWLATFWSVGQFVAALGVTIGALVYLMSVPAAKPEVTTDDRGSGDEPVRVPGPYLVRIEPNTPLSAKIQITEVVPTRISAPVLIVTGTIVASLRPGSEEKAKEKEKQKKDEKKDGAPADSKNGDFWQFNAPEVLSTFTDWQKARADVTFSTAQLVRIRDAAVERTKAQRELVATMVKLEAAGTETKKQLALERATLKQYEIQEQKEIYEAETAIRMAQRNESASARQLQQAGLDPVLLNSVTSDLDLVMADVPEGYLSRVRIGDGCKARFFGIPDQEFHGRVKSIPPVIAKDRRALRVLFTVEDLKDQLRPGMFAEIGLGTDPRDALLAPVEGVIHVGRTDYMLVASGEPNVWRATPVEVGEMREGRIEVIRGLTAGARVIGQGAILLKPAVVRAVTPNGNHQPGGAP